MTLLIVRHGQTVWNTQHRMQGQQDSPLTELGRELARRLAVRLEGVHIDGIVTSPLPRAQDTARILAGACDAPVSVDERLKELNLGRWEGEDMRTIETRYPIDFEWFWENPNRYMELRGGETFDALLARTLDFLRDMHSRNGVYLAVTHALALRALRQNALGIETNRSRMSMPSCCLCQLDAVEQGWDIKLFGDRYHHDESVMSWWHGSSERIDVLRAGSSITRVRALSEAFAHSPTCVCIATDSSITHNGKKPGHLYRVAEPVGPEDAVPHPRSSMPVSYEFVTRRALRLELVCALDASAPVEQPVQNPGLTLNI